MKEHLQWQDGTRYLDSKHCVAASPLPDAPNELRPFESSLTSSVSIHQRTKGCKQWQGKRRKGKSRMHGEPEVWWVRGG